MDSKWELVRVSPISTEVIKLKMGINIIGRAFSSNIALESSVISRQHCSLIVNDEVELQDLKSSNGTFVNNVQIEDIVILQHDDTLGLGLTEDLNDNTISEDKRFIFKVKCNDRPKSLNDIFPPELQKALLVNGNINEDIITLEDDDASEDEVASQIMTYKEECLNDELIDLTSDDSNDGSKWLQRFSQVHIIDPPQMEAENIHDSHRAEIKPPEIVSPTVPPELTKPPEIEPPQIQPQEVEPPEIEPPDVETAGSSPKPEESTSACSSTSSTKIRAQNAVVKTNLNSKTKDYRPLDPEKSLFRRPIGLIEALPLKVKRKDDDASEDEVASQIMTYKEECLNDELIDLTSDDSNDGSKWLQRFSQVHIIDPPQMEAENIHDSHRAEIKPPEIASPTVPPELPKPPEIEPPQIQPQEVEPPEIEPPDVETAGSSPKPEESTSACSSTSSTKRRAQSAVVETNLNSKTKDYRPLDPEKSLFRRPIGLIEALPLKVKRKASKNLKSDDKPTVVKKSRKGSIGSKPNEKLPKNGTDEITEPKKKSEAKTQNKITVQPRATNRGTFLTEPISKLLKQTTKAKQNDAPVAKETKRVLKAPRENIERKSATEQPPPKNDMRVLRSDRIYKQSAVETEPSGVPNVVRKDLVSLKDRMLRIIVSWSPLWPREFLNRNDNPDIFGNNRKPMIKLHSYQNFSDYANIISDLLLMEIWEQLKRNYKNIKSSENERLIELMLLEIEKDAAKNPFVTTLFVSFRPTNSKDLQLIRDGQILQLYFTSDSKEKSCFCYVENCRQSKNEGRNFNANAISLGLEIKVMASPDINQMQRKGIRARIFNSIKNEISLCEAIDCMRQSPLRDIVLRPRPDHFSVPAAKVEMVDAKKSQWTCDLNPSQLRAAETCVNMALSKHPHLQMIQGPPGTGKSHVICAATLRYFYDIKPPHGKILICATNNAAVDEIVLRLLDIRQKQPRGKRLRLVRYGREESMHPKAKDVSLRMLALRNNSHSDINVDEEIKHLEGQIASIQREEAAAETGSRAAICRTRARDCRRRLDILRGESASPMAENDILERAQVIAATLSGTTNSKLKCLKGKIDLCIIDEAGQVTEPEALLPLLLGVTRIALIGDPEQLPGLIFSQTAKELGLGESLFTRLGECSRNWPSHPAILLNEQYRMRPQISLWPNETFYAGLLKNGAVPPMRELQGLPEYRIIEVTPGQGARQTTCIEEAWATTHIASAISSNYPTASIAILTPYTAHANVLQKCLQRISSSIQVSTVDQFQGKERDIVVVSLARKSGLGFLRETGRMAVLLTRAKQCLIVLLNPRAFVNNELWGNLYTDAIERSVTRTMPQHLCQEKIPDQKRVLDIIK